MTKRKIYWLCQLFGWGLYGCVQVFLYTIAQRFDLAQLMGVFFQVIYFIASTHLFRNLLIRREWLNLRLVHLIPRVLLITLVLSVLNYGYLLLVEWCTGGITRKDLMFVTFLINTLGYWVLYFIWTIFYFTFHYIQRYDKSLKAETAAREMELSNLKAQLNPHFIFNALNSIRALIDEDPRKSKESITQLSHILRNSLASDRRMLVSFMEELKIVMDYLALEGIRYEERLKTTFSIDPKSNHFMIPPLMLQTLVENGVKHGIANLKSGGFIDISTQASEKHLIIEIRNSGQLDVKKSQKGLGLENTKKRLTLIYGQHALFKMVNEEKKVVLTQVTIPKAIE